MGYELMYILRKNRSVNKGHDLPAISCVLVELGAELLPQDHLLAVDAIEVGWHNQGHPGHGAPYRIEQDGGRGDYDEHRQIGGMANALIRTGGD